MPKGIPHDNLQRKEQQLLNKVEDILCKLETTLRRFDANLCIWEGLLTIETSKAKIVLHENSSLPRQIEEFGDVIWKKSQSNGS